MRVDSLARLLLRTALEVELIDVGRSDAWLVELILNSLLVFDAVPLQGAEWSSLSLGRAGRDAVHVMWVLNDWETLWIWINLWFGKRWQLVTLCLQRDAREFACSLIDPTHVIFLTEVFHSVFVVKCLLPNVSVVETVGSTVTETSVSHLLRASLLV